MMSFFPTALWGPAAGGGFISAPRVRTARARIAWGILLEPHRAQPMSTGILPRVFS